MPSHAVGLAHVQKRRGWFGAAGPWFAAVLPVTPSMNRKPAVNIVTLELLRSTVQAPPPGPGLGGSQRRQFALKMFGAGVSGHDLGDQSIAA
jgi:hypothetical protein